MAERSDLPCHFTLLLIAGKSRLVGHPNVCESRFRSVNNPMAHLSALLRVVARRPEVLICSLWRTVPIGLVVKLLQRDTKLVYFVHSDSPAHLLDRALSEVMMCFSDAIWADSGVTLEARTRARHTKLRRVISFVTERRVLPEPVLPGVGPHFVCWGRLNHAKGIDRALRFVARLAAHRPDTTFEIWGPDNGQQERLELLSRELGLEKAVRFMGVAQTSELPGIARRHSFYLQLSRREGMAMSVVEAMQLGLVPVVTAVGEMQRYCQVGQTGLICDPDRLDGTVQEVLRLLEDPAEHARLREGARARWASAPLYADDICQAAYYM